MSALVVADRILTSGKYKSVLSLIKGFRNGAVYGAKIRLPHALVITFLFGQGPLVKKLRLILQATYTHSKNLASFVLTYKALLLLLRQVETSQKTYHSFIAAFIGGYVIWGKFNKINEQINLYLLSRILYGLAKLAVDKGYIIKPSGDVFPWFAALVWGTVLWLFEHHRAVLQTSLRSSMTYLYHDSNVWHSLRDFLLYNR
ncbi:hypothetical protein NP493_910g00026 [Ridgeia piscesae]|uniref:Peroxisomal membrane protein 4 n=1 Tax=Ridgeia piscesae TaxID=27915 RepID=A0AAD9KM95_RIDPI|nr:hypothetical protein NP493_910g00026 [Ridgeia piscesae]